MTVVVEDNIYKFPYQLLNPILSESLVGSNGNFNLCNKILEVGGNMLVFVDVSADNDKTVIAYKKAINVASTLPNAFVIPIPCIEYYFIRAFLGYVNSDTSAVLLFDDYRVHTTNVSGRTLKTTKGYEKFCKSVVREYKPCMKNSMFVTNDCVCNTYFNANYESLPLETKQFKLFYSLPILATKYFDSNILQHVRQSILVGEYLFESMAKKFYSYGIIDKIKTLPNNIV